MEKTKKEVCEIKEILQKVLHRNRFAVLATQLKGQPHASFIAYTPLEELRFIAFATYRNTLKYQSILCDPRVAILIEDGEGKKKHSEQRLIITAVGEAMKDLITDLNSWILKHLKRHPHLERFLKSPDCEFVVIKVRSYQVVTDINNVRWYSIKELTEY